MFCYVEVVECGYFPFFFCLRLVWLVVPSRLQLRVIRAFKSTLEDLEERRSCQSIQSLQSMRNNRSQQGSRSPAAGGDEDTAGHLQEVIVVTPTNNETELLVPPPSPPDTTTTFTTQSTYQQPTLPHRHYFINSCIVPSPEHFNNLVSQTIHFNMAVHSSSLEPSYPVITEFPKLVHETSIWRTCVLMFYFI